MGVIKLHIEITPGVCGGKPRIAGHRIRVQDIVIMHDRMGKDPYEIVNDYPSITLADVYAALVYYMDNMEEIRRGHCRGRETRGRDACQDPFSTDAETQGTNSKRCLKRLNSTLTRM